MKYKSFNNLIFLIFFTLCNNFSFPQKANNQNFNKDIGRQSNSKISLSIQGGIIYHSPGAGIGVFDGYYNHKQETQSFVSSLFFSYQLDEKQFIDLGISIVSSDNNAENNSSTVNWNFKIYTTSLTYKYITKTYSSKLRPFVGVGLNYIINRVNILVTGIPDRLNSGKLNTSGYGFELYTGLLYSINNKIKLSTEVKINYRDEYAFADYNIGAGSLSLQLLFGIGYIL